ncbi:uncharacterized protein [Branchiostoma lanceolatum]|uniref:uncharacterized protein n=1 Tax=Branchiostoma lanceolatum TaxID=7740 RepID=UPI00345546A2
MAAAKTALCVFGALGWLFITTSEACDLSAGVPLEQCLGDYVCHNGTCSDRFDNFVACAVHDISTRCSLPSGDLDGIIQSISPLNTSLCSASFWDIGVTVASVLDTAGKCTERFIREYAECSKSFLQLKFLEGNASADALCREYQRSLQCINELSQSECCFDQSEQATLFVLTESNPFCQCANVTSSDVAMTTERPNIMTSVVPFSRGCPTGNDLPKSTAMPTSSSTAVSSSRLVLFATLMIFNFVVSLVP